MNFKTIVMSVLFNIYSLSNPINNKIGYVGATSLLLNVRYSQHKYNALTKNSQTKVSIWFREVVNQGVLPKISHLEVCKEEDWAEREIYWIDKFNNLSNTKKGGTGVVLNRSIESKQRSINAHKKPVVLLDKEFNFLKEFESCSICAEYLNVGVTSITNALSKIGTHSVGKGLVVYFKDDYASDNYEKVYRGMYRDIYQYDLEGNFIKKFRSIYEAFNKTKPSKYSSGLYEAAQRKGRCGNYKWSFDFCEKL